MKLRERRPLSASPLQMVGFAMVVSALFDSWGSDCPRCTPHRRHAAHLVRGRLMIAYEEWLTSLEPPPQYNRWVLEVLEVPGLTIPADRHVYVAGFSVGGEKPRLTFVTKADEAVVFTKKRDAINWWDHLWRRFMMEARRREAGAEILGELTLRAVPA